MSYKTLEEVEWKDHIGQKLKEGDFIFTLHDKYTFEKVKKLGVRHNSIWGIRPTVVPQDKVTRVIDASYVLSTKIRPE